ncbi:unnamed protein product [Notodromas monacha]|uniref:RNA helicase n=1 Tax=Notodromas monacha TaxID=399045 RepID=A0A7R9GCF0_9CRUS|nr:unnamed protein product [Notodromas monacha]CAG0917375.1 unnamed protein product [Notodromas monacha]
MTLEDSDRDLLESFGSIDPFDIPNASEENKLLQQQLKEKLAIAALLRDKAAKFDEKIKVVQKHLKDVDDDRQSIEAKITSYLSKITKIRNELKWDEDTYKSWSEKLAQKHEDNLNLVKYAEFDEARIKDLSLKLEKLSVEAEGFRIRVEEAASEKSAQEAKFKKTQKELLNLQAQKTELSEKWEQVLSKVSEKDSENQEMLQKLEKAEEALRAAQERQRIVKKAEALEIACTSARKAQMVEGLLADSEAYRNSLKTKIDRLTNKKAKQAAEVKEMHGELASLTSQIAAAKKNIKKLDKSIKETEDSIRNKEEMSFKLDFKIVKLDREIAMFMGRSHPDSDESIVKCELKESKSQYEAELEKLRKSNKSADSENQLAFEQLKRARNSANKLIQEKVKADNRLRDLETKVTQTNKSLKELKAEQENMLVERNLLQVDVRKNIKKVQTKARILAESEKEQLELEKSALEEQEVRKCELENVKLQLRNVNDEKQSLQMNLNDRTDKAEKSKKRYETILEAMGAKMTNSSSNANASSGQSTKFSNKKRLASLVPDGPGLADSDLKNASFFIITRAQEKQELEMKITDMSKQILASREELMACKRTLDLVTGNNSMFRKQTIDAAAKSIQNDEDALKKMKAEEDYESARIELNMKTLEIEEIGHNVETLENFVTKLRAEVEANGREMEELDDRKALLLKEINDQLRRLEIATNRIKRLTKELKTKDKLLGESEQRFEEFMKDIELKKLKSTNRKALNSFRELAQIDIAVWASVERAFLECHMPSRLWKKSFAPNRIGFFLGNGSRVLPLSSHSFASKDALLHESAFELKHRRPPHVFEEKTAKHVFNNYFQLVKSYFKNGEKFAPVLKTTHGTKGGRHLWNVACKIHWPISYETSASSSSKKHAEALAMIQILNHLQSLNKIKDGKPVFYSMDEVEVASSILKEPLQLSIPPDCVSSINRLANHECTLRESLRDHLSKPCAELNRDKLDTSRREGNWDAESLAARNGELIRKSRNLRIHNRSLPVNKYQSVIVDAVRENPVVVLSGDTGCGKSTQVPQIILDELISQRMGADASIIVAQPRRISAISLAKRIAYERRERVGETIGYQVRLDARLPETSRGSIVFCTGGILLRKIMNDPTLEGVSHVILDEAHERDVTTDILMVFLRRAVKANPNLKVVIMSATINVDLFARYFHGAPVVNVPGRLFPVNVHYLDSFVNTMYGNRIPDEVLGILRTAPDDNFEQDRITSSAELVAKTVEYIHGTRDPGAILCFLPGWQEIKAVKSLLEEYRRRDMMILPVHSKLSNQDQEKIFSKPDVGVRKVILATNIAETSITIDDVKYVVDSGFHRQNKFNPRIGVEYLATTWISKANANQRKGRAGRVSSGECFRLYPERVFDILEPFSVPEMLRCSLERVVLDVKSVWNNDEKVSGFFDEVLQSPDAANVERALKDLREDGFIDGNEELSWLGKVLTPCPTHPKLAKALFYGAAFRCAGSVSDVVAALSAPRDILVGNVETRKEIRQKKRSEHASSDHLATLNFLEKCRPMTNSFKELVNYCWTNMIHHPTLRFVFDLSSSFLDYLEDRKLYRGTIDHKMDSDEHVVLAALCAGLGLTRIVKVKHGEVSKGIIDTKAISLRTQSNHKALAGSESVFGGGKTEKSIDPSTACLMGFVQIESVERRARLLRDLSQISPLVPLLMCGRKLNFSRVDEETWQISVDHSKVVQVSCDETTRDALEALRKSLEFSAQVFGLRSFGGWDLNEEVDASINHHRVAVIDALREVLRRHTVLNPVAKLRSTKES